LVSAGEEAATASGGDSDRKNAAKNETTEIRVWLLWAIVTDRASDLKLWRP
jgi:hypothetical protein